MTKYKTSKIPWRLFLIYILLLLYFLPLFARKIDLTTADLGRHIKNGEIFFATHQVIATNTYSYTQTQFPVITHHWGFGVLFYIFWKIGGFPLISFIYAVVMATTVFLFFWISKKKFGIIPSFGSLFLVVPLIGYRIEIRPEGISYLFLAIYWLILTLFIQRRLKFHLVLILLIPLQILWVNVHIFFILGPLLIASLFIQSLFDDRLNRKDLIALFISVTLSCLVNPFFIKGALAPFTIFRQYGYMIAENQSILFMQKRFHEYIYIHAEIVSLFVLFGIFTGFLSIEKVKRNLSIYIMTVFFLLFSFKMVRAIPLLGFSSVIFLSHTFSYFLKNLKISGDNLFTLIAIAISGFFFLLVYPTNYSPFYNQLGFGLVQGVNDSAAFYKKNHLNGPIFNNYDLGGYFIYHFYPNQKVFVDNRPEAYSVSFFKDKYIAAQEDETVWEKVDKEYRFNVIYFYRHDNTPWGQPFLIRRIKDPSWVPIFVDSYTIIFVKNIPQNQLVIGKYRLPESMFVFSR